MKCLVSFFAVSKLNYADGLRPNSEGPTGKEAEEYTFENICGLET